LWEGGVEETLLLDSGRSESRKTFTCAPCNRVVVVPFKCKPEEVGGFCMLEFRPVCPECHVIGTCTPFEKRLEQMEARKRLLTAMGMA